MIGLGTLEKGKATQRQLDNTGGKRMKKNDSYLGPCRYHLVVTLAYSDAHMTHHVLYP